MIESVFLLKVSVAAVTHRQLICIFTPYLEVSNLSEKEHPNWKEAGCQVRKKMAALGSALLSSLGLTQAERAFRPWWDAIEDHIVYTIIILVCTNLI